MTEANPQHARGAGLAGDPLARLRPLLSNAPLAGAPTLSARDLTVAALAALVFAVVTLVQFWNTWANDFASYYVAGHFFSTGAFDRIYGGFGELGLADLVPGAEVPALDGADETTYPFFYLPWVAWAMAPVATHLSPIAAMNAMLVANIALILASVGLAWRLFARTSGVSLRVWTLLSLAALGFGLPANLAFHLGQMQIAVYALVLLAFERYRAGHVVLAGLVLALAAGLKITPAAFAILFLWDANWRALSSFAAGFAALLLASLALGGGTLMPLFLDTLSRTNDILFLSNIRVSLEGFLYHLGAHLGAPPAARAGDPGVLFRPGWIDLAVKGLFLAGLAATWAATRRLDPERRFLQRLFGLAILVPLCSPLGWIHYYLLPGFMIPALFDRQSRVNTGAVLVFTLLLSLVVVMPLVALGAAVQLHVLLYVPLLLALFARVITPGAVLRG